ncbi:hypothetical protein CEXT_326921 [Caerostris extrusa]|uniref:Uncharacterized protein n=1 Tax=Caerostris extrusa TaxID=172846 RepID=A0AAV4T1S2_CAEEX|nr:hypothetical protein CEXT_326921 [Caerostris extrusa]
MYVPRTRCGIGSRIQGDRLKQCRAQSGQHAPWIPDAFLGEEKPFSRNILPYRSLKAAKEHFRRNRTVLLIAFRSRGLAWNSITALLIDSIVVDLDTATRKDREFSVQLNFGLRLTVRTIVSLN